MTEPIYYLNGKFVDKSKTNISVWDMGFLRSYGIVEFLITYNAIPFKLADHLTRLYKSAKIIDLYIGMSKSQLAKLVKQTLAKNNFPESSIWIIVTGGVGLTSMIPAPTPTIAILVDEYIAYPKKYFDNGIKIITYKANRMLVEAKSMVYTTAIIALKQAYKKKAIEALYVKNGRVTECMTSNFFIIKKNELYTAKDQDVLSGVTRRIIFDICRNKLRIHKTDLSLKQVLTSDEAFLTASNKEVMPVVKIDDNIVGNGKVGVNTKKIIRWFSQYIKKQV